MAVRDGDAALGHDVESDHALGGNELIWGCRAVSDWGDRGRRGSGVSVSSQLGTGAASNGSVLTLGSSEHAEKWWLECRRIEWCWRLGC